MSHYLTHDRLLSIVTHALARTFLIVAIVFLFMSQRARSQENLNDLPREFRQAAQDGFEAAAMTGDERLIRHYGGHIGFGGRVFAPGQDEAAIVHQELMDALRPSGAGVAGSGSFRPSVPGASYGDAGDVGGFESSPPRMSFDEKRKIALEELRRLVDVAMQHSDSLADAAAKPRKGVQADYLPAVSALLDTPASETAAEPVKSFSAQERGVASSRLLREWAAASKESLLAAEAVYGFIERSDKALFLFLDESGDELAMPEAFEFPSSGYESTGPADKDAQETVRLKLPPSVAANLAKVLETSRVEVEEVARQRELAAKSVNPAAAYRWTFGQVFDGDSPTYTRFRDVCPKRPQIRIALTGKAQCVDDQRTVEVERVLVFTTPLPTQADFIAEHKGVPAALIDLEQVHDMAFIQCGLFCEDAGAWKQKAPAVWQLCADRDAYLRTILQSPVGDINKANKELRDEIQLCTDAKREDVLAEAAVSKGLQASGLDKKYLQKYTRLLVQGSGRKIVDQLVALGGGRSAPCESVPAIAEELTTFAKLAKEPVVVEFVQKNWLDSFLILVVDHSEVCLCDLSTMLRVQETYLPICAGFASDDGVSAACRIAEIGTWFDKFSPGDRLPWKPPFSALPASVHMKRKMLNGYLTTWPTPDQ